MSPGSADPPKPAEPAKSAKSHGDLREHGDLRGHGDLRARGAPAREPQVGSALLPARGDAYGRVPVPASALRDLMYAGLDPGTLDVLSAPEVDEYNAWCGVFGKAAHAIRPFAEPELAPEAAHAARASRWLLHGAASTAPEAGVTDVRAVLLARCADEPARARVAMEMDLFEARGLLGLLRAAMALVEHFRESGVVWGVGRGSSCASYCLYLAGLHRVDALEHDLDISEFLKPGGG